MKKSFLIAAFVVTFAGCASRTYTNSKIIWANHPAVFNGDEFFPNVCWLPAYEIGFREDGVVVWRKVKKP